MAEHLTTTVIKMEGASAPVLNLATPQFLNGVDYLVLGVVVFSILVSLWRGFTKEAVSLLAWLVALWSAIKFGQVLEPHLIGFISNPLLCAALSYALIFLGALMVGGICNYCLARFISGAGLSVADRFFGIFFGAARGVLVVAVFVLVSGATPLTKEAWWEGSVFLPHFERAAIWLRAYLPDTIKQEIHFPA